MTTAYGHTVRTDADIIARSLDDASTTPFWLDDPARPVARPALRGDTDTDLLIVGGGFCGLWTAILAKERDPERRVTLIEGQRIAWSASGKNGGFCEPSLTHGEDNAKSRFSDELAVIARLEAQNFADFRASLERYGIDAEWEETGVLAVATEPHQEAWLDEGAHPVLRGDALAAYGNSPLFRAGIYEPDASAFVHPAKLAWGLARTAESLGVKIAEHTPATGLRSSADGVVVTHKHGSIRAAHVALATNAFPSLVPRLRLFTVPIYDYVLMTEPLTDAQLESIGWTGRHGLTDLGHEFHYSRKTADNRILYGGFDAVYHRGGRVRTEHDQRPETFERLADHFFRTFPQLGHVRFTHKWGGAIDMSTQLVAFHGLAHGGRVAYSAGYTGLGVGATRFGGDTMLDLLEGLDTERTQLRWARTLPIPIPPEPVAYPIIQTMRAAVQRADETGNEGLVLRLARRFGVSFDS